MDWKQIVKQVAPALGTALGGNLGGIATKFIADAILGKDSTEQELQSAIVNASPELLAKIKQMDIDFKVKMSQVGIDVMKMELEDVANARNRQIAMHDWAPNIFGGLVLIFYGIIFFYKGTGEIRVSPEDMGALQAMVVLVLGYFFGSMHTKIKSKG